MYCFVVSWCSHTCYLIWFLHKTYRRSKACQIIPQSKQEQGEAQRMMFSGTWQNLGENQRSLTSVESLFHGLCSSGAERMKVCTVLLFGRLFLWTMLSLLWLGRLIIWDNHSQIEIGINSCIINAFHTEKHYSYIIVREKCVNFIKVLLTLHKNFPRVYEDLFIYFF